MGKGEGQRSQQDRNLVLAALEDHILETHTFVSISDLIVRTSLSEQRVKTAMSRLHKLGEISEVFSKPKVVTLYAPSYMLNELLRLQAKPGWAAKWRSNRRGKLENEIKTARAQLEEFDVLERLLYGTGVPLEESVAEALRSLEFKNVIHHVERNDYADITFEWKGTKYLCEAKGKAKQADKDDILQLDGWRRTEIGEGGNPDKVQGIAMINHHRHLDPSERPSPLTNDAEKFRRMYGFKLLRTSTLYRLVSEEQGKEDGSKTDEGRRVILKGEENTSGKVRTLE